MLKIFVRIAAKSPSEICVDERQIEALTYAFAKEWKRTISEMQGDIMTSFTIL